MSRLTANKRRIRTRIGPRLAGRLMTAQTDLLPGFVLPLSRLLAKADQWKRPPKPRKPEQSPKPDPPAGGSDGSDPPKTFCRDSSSS